MTTKENAASTATAVTDAVRRADWTPADYLARPTMGRAWTKTDPAAICAAAARNAGVDAWAIERGTEAPAWVTKALLRDANTAIGHGCAPERVVLAAALTPTIADRYATAYRTAARGEDPPFETLEDALRQARSLIAQGKRAVDVLDAVEAAGAELTQYVITAHNTLVGAGSRPADALAEALRLIEAEPTDTAPAGEDSELARALAMCAADGV